MSAKGFTLAMTVLSGLAGILASVSSDRGNTPIPEEKVSWSGQSQYEIDHREKYACWARLGWFLIGLSFLISTIAAIVDFFS